MNHGLVAPVENLWTIYLFTHQASNPQRQFTFTHQASNPQRHTLTREIRTRRAAIERLQGRVSGSAQPMPGMSASVQYPRKMVTVSPVGPQY